MGRPQCGQRPLVGVPSKARGGVRSMKPMRAPRACTHLRGPFRTQKRAIHPEPIAAACRCPTTITRKHAQTMRKSAGMAQLPPKRRHRKALPQAGHSVRPLTTLPLRRCFVSLHPHIGHLPVAEPVAIWPLVHCSPAAVGFHPDPAPGKLGSEASGGMSAAAVVPRPDAAGPPASQEKST
jgi:hypothetical protein